ncbi:MULTISPECIES: hypothetical protein [unclassified Kribbella]|uniref:hypothetical protein n=1 Tax=unclassified Kribbella TaxID=2644121 RepID=UPI0030194D2E
MTIRVRDLAATGLAITLAVLYLAFRSIEQLPLIESTRDMTSVALILGGALVLLLLSVERYDVVGLLTLSLAVLSVVLGACSLALADTAAADTLLTAFIATVLAVWAIELAEHVTFSAPETASDPSAPADHGTHSRGLKDRTKEES